MSARITVLHAVTDSLSTILMRGQLSYLKTCGFDPALLSNPGKELTEIGAREGYPVYGVAMRRDISPGSDLISLFHIWRLLRHLKPVISNCGTPKAGLLVGVTAYFARVPCRVYTLRGLRLETATGFKRKLLTVTERIACFCAHRVICVSPSLRDRAIHLGIVPRDKTVLLGAGSSNGVDSDRFSTTPAKKAQARNLRQHIGIQADQFVIGFAGRFTRDKGLPELVQAFKYVRKQIPQTILLLIGNYEEGDPIPENTKIDIESEPGILRLGFTSEMDPYYSAMDVFVLPTHREGFPNTVLEAQAAGLPVVTTNATGAIDAIEHGVTGLLAPVKDPVRLADAILTLLSDPVKMQSMGQQGRARVLKSFRNEAIWEALTSLYKEMLVERGYPVPVDTREETMQCAQIS
jgi:glycosyltransferase involved in cell wall biosynthesis